MKSPLLLVLALTLGSLAVASPPRKSKDDIRPSQLVSLSIILDSFSYAEQWTPPDKSTESGWLFGIALRYTFKGGRALPLWGRAQFDFSPSGTEYGSNETDFFGQSIDYTEKSKDWFSRFEFDAGYTFYRVGGSPIDLIAYTGYGYRFWRREIANHNNLLGYREDYSWSYIPIGVRGELAMDRNWSVSLDVAFRLMVSGQIYIALEQYNNPTLTLGNVPGWHFALPVEYLSNSLWGVGVTFWYEYSAIGESNESERVIFNQQYHTVHEPASSTDQFGFTFTGSIHF